MLFSRNFRLLSIFALMVAAPQVLCAAEPVGDSTITSKRYVDNKIPADSTAHLLVTPQASGGNATKRAITTAGTGITGLESASSSGATNIPTAYAVKEAIGTAVSGADISDHTVNGAPLFNEASYYYGSGVGGASSTAKTVQIDSITTSPTAGMTIVVNPATTATSGTSMTLNLNGTGAKAVKYDGSTALTNAKSAAIWKKDVPVVFVYDGTNWLYEGNKYIAGTGITVSGSTITNAGVRSVATGTGNDGTISVNTNGTPADVAVKGWNKTVKYDGANAVGSLTKGVWVDTDGTVKAMTHSVNADVPSTAEFTDTTYSFATGSDSGTISVTPEGGSAYNVTVKDAEVTTHKLSQGDATGTVITSSATDTQYPSAKAVYNAITSATSGMITDVSGKQDKDNTEVYKVGYNGGWAGLGTTVDTTATGYNADNAVTASAIATALTSKQTKDTENKYHVSKNGAWTVASSAVDVDTTHMKKTNNTDGSVKVAIDTTKLASAGTNITGLTDGSTAADKGKLTTAYAVKEAIGTATSGMITDVSGKQDKDNNEVYKVGYNGGWANANTAVAVDTTYLDKTNNDNGSVTVKVDTTKLASAKTDITNLTSSSTAATKGKLTTAYAVKQSLDDKQNKLPYDATANLIIAPTTDGGNATKRAIATAGTDITGLTSSSTDADKIKIPTAYAVKQGLDGKQNKLPYDATANLIIAPTTNGGNATKRAITTAGTGITGLESASSSGATNIPTAYAVKEAIGTATSGMITDVSGKQDKDNNEVYKVGYNGGWANANTAVAVDTTYLDKTNNDNGSVTVKVDTTKLASAKTDITNLTSSSTAANKGKLTTAYAVKQSLDDKQQKITHSSTNKVVITPTTDGGATGTRDITTAGANITGLESASSSGATNIPTAYAVKEAIGTAVSGADISAHTVNGAPLSNAASYYYGSGVGAAGTAAKTVTISSITTAPTEGMTIVVNPAATASTETSLTLNLNSTGAKTVKYNGSTTLTAEQSKAIWKKDVPVVFVYDGTNWLYSGKEYTAGTGISISDANAITNTGVRAVTASGTGAADGTISVNTNGESANVAVKGWDNKQTKPSSVSNGKVLTYTGTNANSNVSAKYIQVPVANNAPNGGSATVSTLADIWVE